MVLSDRDRSQLHRIIVAPDRGVSDLSMCASALLILDQVLSNQDGWIKTLSRRVDELEQRIPPLDARAR